MTKLISRNEKSVIIIEIACAIVLFYCAALTSFYGCDYMYHMELAESISIDTFKHFPEFFSLHCYPLWHILAKIAMKVFFMPAQYAAGFISGACFVVMYLTTCWHMKKSFTDVSAKVIAFLSAALYLVAPVYIPWYNPEVILGQDTPNTWHSPTHTLIRAVALFAFLLIISVVERVKQSEYQKNIGLKTGILIALLLFCSNLAKPNFVQVLYPALVFYMIYHLIISRGRAIKMGVQLALTCIPSLLLMIYQYISAFYNGSSAGGVTISWFEYWHIYTPSIPISMLLVLLFPLIMLGITIKRRQMTEGTILSWLMLLVASVEKAMLIELGPRATHGNFGWGYTIALYFVWFCAIKQYVRCFICNDNWKDKKNNLSFAISTLALFLHLAAGLYYLYTIIFLQKII